MVLGRRDFHLQLGLLDAEQLEQRRSACRMLFCRSSADAQFFFTFLRGQSLGVPGGGFLDVAGTALLFVQFGAEVGVVA